ncbi:hypothetical protein [Streptomyces sp. NPDC048157]|uniref:WDGH domain-containing protein n=1 Tax=Streptomyces sp. NPDC048157 TaxID=3365503 RepID=UPI00371DCC01
MTDRIPLGDLTLDALDALYDRVAELEVERQKADAINAEVDAETEQQLNDAIEVAQYYKALAERTQAWGEQHRDRANRYRARTDAVRAELTALNSETRGLNPFAMAGRRDAVACIRATLQAISHDTPVPDDPRVTALEAERDAVYRERAHLVALLATLHPSHIGHTDPNAPDWDVVTIETPAGQMTWHIAERDMDLFTHVQPTNRICRGWDGHTTDEKYQRMRDLTQATPSLLKLEVVADRQAEHIKQLTARVEQAGARVAELEQQLADADTAADHTDRTCEAVTRAETAEAAIERVRRLCDLTIGASVRVQAVQQARDTLAALDEQPQQSAAQVCE